MIARACRTCGRDFNPTGKAYYCSAACRCGTDAGYNAGCGCDRCRAAHARNHKRLRVKPNPTVPAIGTHRRIQALACLGWSGREVSRRMGKSRHYVSKVMTRPALDAATVLLVARLYDELSMTRSTTATSSRTAAAARSRGWAPPLAWDEGTIDDPAARPYGHASRQARAALPVDPVVVDRFLAGDHDLPTTRAERIEIARRWAALGRPLAELGRVTGWKPERYLRLSDQAAAA